MWSEKEDQEIELLMKLTGENRDTIEGLYVSLGRNPDAVMAQFPRLGSNQFNAGNQQAVRDSDLEKAIQNSKEDIKGTSTVANEEDVAVQQAILDQMKTKSSILSEPLPEHQRMRKVGDPPGLQNFGNSCFFNVLVQTLFNIPEFVQAICKHKFEEKEEGKEGHDKKEEKVPDSLEGTLEILKEFQNLFNDMILSNKKYQSADKVFN